MRNVIVILGAALLMNTAYAWPGVGMKDIAGNWTGCIDGESDTIHIRADGYLWGTNSDDEDVFKTYCDVFAHTGTVRYMNDHIVLMCPDAYDGEIDTSYISPLFIRSMDKNNLIVRTDPEDTYYYMLHRAGTPSKDCGKGGSVRQLIEKLRQRRAK